MSCDTRGRDLQINTDDGLVRVEMLLVTSMQQISPGNVATRDNGA
jgi:hypothetical protein